MIIKKKGRGKEGYKDTDDEGRERE